LHILFHKVVPSLKVTDHAQILSWCLMSEALMMGLLHSAAENHSILFHDNCQTFFMLT